MAIPIFIGECIAIVALVNITWVVTETAFRRRRARLAAQTAPDWGAMMQAAAEVHLEKVNNGGSQEEADVEVDRSTLAFYCGCDSCVIREVLVGAWPVIAMMLHYSCEHDLEVSLTAWHSPHD